MTRHGAAAMRLRDRPVSIAVKLGLVMGAMTVILAVVASVLLVQLREVTTTYDGILGSEVHSALQAREMQVEFKKQVQEWKDILLRGFAPADLATYSQQFHDESAKVDQLGDDLLASTPDEAVRAEVRQFRTEHDTLNRNYEAALTAFVAAGAKDPTVPDRAVRGQDRPPTDRIDGIVARLETAVADRVAAQNAGVTARQRLLAIVGAVALVFLLATLAFVVAGIVRPLRALTRAAYEAAHRTLPEAIGEIRATPGDAPPQLPAVEVRSRDELRDLADALSSMQASAVSLAFDQHRAEREASDILVNLGRRNQSLLKRTLGYISELESDEHDPEVLAQLFRLDHATTRVRRNAESMLVLAGAEQTRTWSRPVPVAEVVRAALSEIEDYARVDLHHVEDAALVGAAVADVVHLIAELTENATHFSPPTSRVVVLGLRLSDGYRIRVVDRGVGMTAGEMDAANARIGQAPQARTDSPLLGLYVVGRLAARHDITVRLEPSAGMGITATVTFPGTLLCDTTPPTGVSALVPAAAAADPAEDPPTTEHRVVPAAQVPAQVQVPEPRAPQPVPDAPRGDRWRFGAGAERPHGTVRRDGADDLLITDARGLARVSLPPVLEPRGRSWTVPSDTASAAAGTTTGWFHALAEPLPDEPDPTDATGPGIGPADGERTNRNGADRQGAGGNGAGGSGADGHPDGRTGDRATNPDRIPRRVRGAQLPDLGDARSGQRFVAPDPDQVRRQLSALHTGVERAQAEQVERR